LGQPIRRHVAAVIGLAFLIAMAAPLQAAELVITFGGDVNFAPSRTTPDPDRVFKFGPTPLADTTAFLQGEWDGDINFINVETVVSDQDGDEQPKTFVFRSLPAQFAHLIDLGVNAFSLANNHAYDHGWPGMAATYDFFRGKDDPARPLLYAGVGPVGAATAPHIATFNGIRVAMAAIGIGPAGFAPQGDRIGMALIDAPGALDAVIAGLAAADADFRILSVHGGIENAITVEPRMRAIVDRALAEGQVNLYLGHHPHVARGVEAGPDWAVFHSLGNLLFLGGAVRDGLPVGHDYGLFGKAYFDVSDQGVRLQAIEVIPLLNVHLAPEPMRFERLQATLAHLSALSVRTGGDAGVSFGVLGPGSDRGAVCFGGPYDLRARVLCCALSRSLQCDMPSLM